jgi:pSer/pThr/pTyr-binding forkhead associated (FHA) protein
MATLTFLQFRGSLRVFELGRDAIKIGRSRRCTLPFPEDSNMSREHAMIRIMPDEQYVLRDMGSKNGTFVNEAPISTHTLKNGDRIRIGSQILTFKA